ncbi:hypothetical protein [Undibacterium sp.]|jgi:predicted lipoprotein with Yx(FWY)xxD motif|uniref:COG4315 family predicted lipoprotein n=1 Tax=Undibacterium sp. TaxID=1914977 RepID=UPI002C554973|nr:hypothetical protein [Undibacterium sp.]HTD03802.1 hypothetical protein [Undibacterium sp.]
MKKLSLLCALLASSLYIGVAYAQEAPVKKDGDILVSETGMTLYTFVKDAAGSGKSACNGACAGLWPPLTASATAKDSGDYTVITREDGSRQWAFKGKPLYMYASDKKAGDRTGDNFKDNWHVIKN